MGLETVTNGFVNELVDTNPVLGDDLQFGDDHIRNTKKVITTTFALFTGALTTTHTEVNFCTGVTSSIQTQLNSLQAQLSPLLGTLTAPSGTKMMFHQASPPTGWTIDATKTDRMLRLVDNSTTLFGTGFGGVHGPTLMNVVPNHTHTAEASGAHGHTLSAWSLTQGSGTVLNSVIGTGNIWTTLSTTSEPAHTHLIGANTNNSNWEPKYINVIVGIKD